MTLPISSGGPRPPRPPLHIDDGTLEALKWLGLVLMVSDHVDKWLLHESCRPVFDAARVVEPLFAFILAYNLARPASDPRQARERSRRTCARLLGAGLLATPAFAVLNRGWWPLDVMFELALGPMLVALQRSSSARIRLAFPAAFVAAGLVAEYFWFGLAVFLAARSYCERPGCLRLAAWVAAVASLGLVNGNAWALAVVPVLGVAPRLRCPVPRLRWAFYLAYPLHLAVLAALVAGAARP